MLIWPVLVLLVVLLFYKRDVTPPWNPPIQPPQAWPQPPAPRTPVPSSPVEQHAPPLELNDVFRRRG